MYICTYNYTVHVLFTTCTCTLYNTQCAHRYAAVPFVCLPPWSYSCSQSACLLTPAGWLVLVCVWSLVCVEDVWSPSPWQLVWLPPHQLVIWLFDVWCACVCVSALVENLCDCLMLSLSLSLSLPPPFLLLSPSLPSFRLLSRSSTCHGWTQRIVRRWIVRLRSWNSSTIPTSSSYIRWVWPSHQLGVAVGCIYIYIYNMHNTHHSCN